MKKFFLITIFIWLSFLFTINIFAFEAELKIDKNEVAKNDYINLKVEVVSTDIDPISIGEISWFKNFRLISRKENVVIVNWSSENEIKNIISFDLTLKAKSEGTFIIWPVVLYNKNLEVKTNSVQIKVWSSIFINNNNLAIQNNTWNTNNISNVNTIPQKSIKDVDEKIETYDEEDKKSFKNNDSLYLFLLILIITWFSFYFIFKNNPQLFKKGETKEDWKKIDKKGKTSNQWESETIYSNKNIEEDKKEIIYPSFDDEKFIDKISEVLKQKLEEKYNIENSSSKSFEEIIVLIDDEKVSQLITTINKAKYSNIKLDNKKVLEKITQI